MREVNVSVIKDTVAKLLIDACCILPDDLRAKYAEAEKNEVSPMGKYALGQIIENAKIAEDEMIPCCQDTGVAVIFLEIGQDVHLVGGDLEEAVNAGVAKGYTEGYLRKSTVTDPLFGRPNPGNNTPGMIYTTIVPGDKVTIRAAAKGFGSENKGALKMLMPADGVEGFKKFVFETVQAADADPCPPIIVGVGVGGTMEKCAMLSKIACMRSVSSSNPDPNYAALEKELEEMINKLGVGPMGFGGNNTCLKVNIESYATHIAGLPVCVNINCHAARHTEAVI